MGKIKEINDLYTLFKEEMTNFDMVNLDIGMSSLIEKESIVVDEENIDLIGKELRERIEGFIKKNQCVFVKMNGKAGIDAKFLVGQLKCFTIEDVVVLLKGSLRIMEEYNVLKKSNDEIIEENNKDGEENEEGDRKDNEEGEENGNLLIIKEWFLIEERNEFRCFVVDGELKGVSQRYINVYHQYEKDEIEAMRDCIWEYFDKKIRNKIEKVVESKYNGEDSDEPLKMIIDLVYIPKRNRVKMIDIEIVHNDNDNIPHEVHKTKDQDDNDAEDIPIKKTKVDLKLFKSWKEIISLEIVNYYDNFRIINTDSDPRIQQYEINPNQFPLELYETDMETLIAQFNTK